ncbi:MAG: cell wall-binding repeat-containing protein [Chloroflexi bacterium]|nr:cell wall-binding repeat-containing protein [Chloroflexota bacterium]
MRHIIHVIVLALVGVLLLVAPASAASTTSDAPPTALSSAKVVIIVGPTGSATSNYRSWADQAYAEAIQYSSNVVKIYSPVATWDVVKPALQGASLVIYLGHGNGWPSPYTFDPAYTTKDGLGLNPTANGGDTTTKYYGEPYLANEIKLAPNAVVILNHLCYASGNSEPGYADPTLDVAMQRVDNFGQGFFKAGAAAVIAEAQGGITGIIRDLFTTQQSILDLWRTQYDYNGNEFSFTSMRSPANSGFMDPDGTPGGYYRSLIGNPDLLTSDVTGNAITSGASSPTSQAPSTVTRLAGSDLYATSSAISAANFAPGVPVAYVATGLDFPDALAGAALGAGWNGPILLVTPTEVPASTTAELIRLRPQRIVVLGGTGVVGDAVLANLAVYTSGGVTRLAGLNRYATAATMSAANFGPGVPVVYVATGLNFPDALTGASVAGSEDGPILLVSTKGIPDVTAAELSRLQPQRIVVLGGTGVVPDTVLSALTSFTSGPVTRLAGRDRYATAAAISASKFAPGVPVVYVATGLDFPDALSGAAVAGSQDVPILLVTATMIPSATAAELTRLRPGSIVLLGATSSVSESVRIQLQGYAR